MLATCSGDFLLPFLFKRHGVFAEGVFFLSVPSPQAGFSMPPPARDADGVSELDSAFSPQTMAPAAFARLELTDPVGILPADGPPRPHFARAPRTRSALKSRPARPRTTTGYRGWQHHAGRFGGRGCCASRPHTCGLGNAHLEQWNRAFAASVADILPTVVWGPTRARLSMSSRLSSERLRKRGQRSRSVHSSYSLG